MNKQLRVPTNPATMLAKVEQVDAAVSKALNELERLREENRILREAVHPRPETKGTAPLILYFENAQQREEFMQAYQEVHPNAKSYNV